MAAQRLESRFSDMKSQILCQIFKDFLTLQRKMPGVSGTSLKASTLLGNIISPLTAKEME